MSVQDIRILGEPDEVVGTLRELKNVFTEKIKYCI